MWRLFKIGFIVAVVLVGLILWKQSTMTPQEREAVQHKSQQASKQAKIDNEGKLALKVARDFCKQFLKYPDDSSFDWDYTAEKRPPAPPMGLPELWVVKSKVKAPNSFGANLTRPFECCVFIGKEKKWICRYLTIEGKSIYSDYDSR